MQKEALYLKSGYVNADILIDCKEPYVIALGGRGIGKSYSILKRLYEREIPFIYMRRTQTQIDAITTPQLSPYNQYCIDTGEVITTAKISKHATGFYKGELQKDGSIKQTDNFALGIALSTFAAIRSLSAEKYKVLFFDEIIPEKHEKPIKEEGLAFANILESLNRNRELTGKEPLKVIMVSNSNALNSQILKMFGCIDIVDAMTRKNQYYRNYKDYIAIFRFIDSPISEQKRNSSLYSVIQNDDFSNMALNNQFSQADYENVCSKPINEYISLCSYGNCTILKHKSKLEYYVIDGVKAREQYSKLPLDKKAFNRKYYFLYGAMLDKRVYYSSASTKIEFEGAFK